MQRWNDHPPLEVQIATVQTTLIDFMDETRRDHKRVIETIEKNNGVTQGMLLEQQRIGLAVETLMREMAERKAWETQHSNDWHGKDDELLVARLAEQDAHWEARIKPFEDERRDNQAVKAFMGRWWKWMTASAAAGASMLALLAGIVKVLDLFG